MQPLVTGGFSQTYLAEDAHLPGNPRCVVKKLQPTLIDANSLELARRLFSSEAEALQKVGKHPQIPALMAYFEEDQEFYLVQEYVRGVTLEEILPPGTCLPEAEVLALLQDCLGILEFVHSQGVIHRDIKPANLIHRQEDGKMVLLDFGAVKQLRVGQSHLVNPTIAIGTAGYTPDEQLRGRPHYTSDLYALGMIGIQALTGLNPESLDRDQQDEIVWQPQVEVDPGTIEILSKMVRRDFRQRYQSTSHLLAVVRDAQEAAPSTIPLRASTLGERRITFNPEAKVVITTHEVYNAVTQAGPVQAPSPRPQAQQSQLDKQMVSTIDAHQPDTSGPQLGAESSESHPPDDPQLESRVPPSKALIPLPNPFTRIHDRITTVQPAEPKSTSRADLRWLKSRNVAVVSLMLLLSGASAGFFSFNRRPSLAQTVDRLESLYEQKKYSECITEAEVAITNLQEPSSSLQTPLTKCQLGSAQLKANQADYGAAIQIATRIPQENAYYDQAQQQVETWSTKLLEDATQTYEEQGKLTAALAVIKQIPTTSIVSEQASQLAQQWQASYKADSALIKAAETALVAGEAEAAMAKVKQVKGPQYLKQKADKIHQAAQELIASRPAPAPVRSRPVSPPAARSVPTAPPRSMPAPAPQYAAAPPPPRPLAAAPAAPAPSVAPPAPAPLPQKEVIQICPGPLCTE